MRRRGHRRPTGPRASTSAIGDALAPAVRPTSDPRSCTTWPATATSAVLEPPARHVPGQRRGHPQRAGRGPGRAGSTGSSRSAAPTSTARSPTAELPLTEALRTPADEPVRRLQGRGRLPRTPGRGSATASMSSGCGPSTTSARARANVRRSGDRQRIARNERRRRRRGAGRQPRARRDLTDVRDVVRAYRLLAEHGPAGEVYNVCSGASVSHRRARRASSSALATSPMRLDPDPDLLRPVDIPVLCGDNTKLVRDDRLVARDSARARPCRPDGRLPRTRGVEALADVRHRVARRPAS